MKRLDIESELLELGAPAGRQGYIQMVTALEFIMQHDDVMCAAANLYPYVAERLNTVPPRVERNIREEIYAIWSRGNQDRLNECLSIVKNVRRAQRNFSTRLRTGFATKR